MSNQFTINVSSRGQFGRGPSRRLRRLEGVLPAIVYGGAEAPQPITLSLKELVRNLETEAFYSHVLTLVIDGKPQSAILKALQRHPATNIPLHADFQRIDSTHAIHMRVPLHFINEDKCVGVKTKGGVINHILKEVEVSCLPQNLPEYIEVDLEKIDIGQSIHFSDLALPAGVTVLALVQGEDHNMAVITVSSPRGGTDEPVAPAAVAEKAEGKKA
jgi:large subunit ribosomal protein L25